MGAVSKSIRYDMLVVTGPTASGKTALAAALAGRLGGEVISADSRQVYRGMDLGTGKDYSDYIVNGRTIQCHLTDIAEPGYKYSVYEYQRDFLEVYKYLKDNKIFPVVCGGSGMYIDSVVSGYRMLEVPADNALRAELEQKDPEELIAILASFKKLHNRSDLDSKMRMIRAIEIEKYHKMAEASLPQFPELNPLVTGILYDRDTRRERISLRLKERLGSGMVEEVRGLLERGIPAEALIYYGLEYKYITLYVTGRLTYEEMAGELETAIHRYSKRQMTWFRGMERRGIAIHWIDGNLPLETKINLILELLANP
ncbi:MAG: tRNA (adenosine(37)-N6)-dimethylallyltransferase MiaA [Bacteroidales bacterium]|nr:tRNA (adenosine(37)-N6)-dimethylallyltransferase MiaA [Bacteroidales bacterium]